MNEQKTERTEFDYERAWHECAKPAFEALSPEIRALFERTCEVAKDLRQNTHCDMIWPEDGGELRRAFEALGDLDLAVAARAAHYYGHWSPEGTAEKTAGGTWKFANYADQVLRARLGASRDVKSGAGCMILEGAIRVGVSTKWSWTFEEVCPATTENLRIVRIAIGRVQPIGNKSHRKTWDDYSDAVMACARDLAIKLVPEGALIADLFNAAERFRCPEGEIQRRHETRRQAATNAKRDLESVARAVVAIRAACRAINEATDRAPDSLGAKDVAHEIHLLFVMTGTNDEFNARALARADEIERS